MNKTLDDNCKILENPDRTINVKSLMWGGDNLNEKFDFIFGTDVVYRDFLYHPFLTCLTHHLSKKGTALGEKASHRSATSWEYDYSVEFVHVGSFSQTRSSIVFLRRRKFLTR